jgi:transcriptional regulator CtsR
MNNTKVTLLMLLLQQLKLPVSHAIHHRVVQMLFAKNVMVQDHAHACQNIQEILTQAVDQSAFSIQIAIEQEHVYETSVWTPVQVHVV